MNNPDRAPRPTGRRRRWAVLAAALALVLALSACGSSTKGSTLSGAGSGSAAGSGADPGRSSGMSGMSMGGSQTTASMEVDGVKPIPSQLLATADWQGMKIQARTMTAAPFVIFNGTTERMVKPPEHVSFHLMIDLTDEHTGVAIPYATVWAIIRKGNRVVYNDQQWPMLSAYMGPHYGNDVSLPGAGHYKLELLITPPVAARHMEYAHIWLKPHTIDTSFTWSDPS